MASNNTPSTSDKAPPKAKLRFRIQEAILILRQGKSHPLWREAAWHLMEHAGKDTQLLLEAQRDLIAAIDEPESWWQKYRWFLIGGTLSLSLVGLLIWRLINYFKDVC